MNRHLLRIAAFSICLALVVGLVSMVSPARADVNVAVVVPAPYLVLSADERAVEKTVMLAMLAAFFDVPVDVVVLGKSYPYADIAVILHLHRSSRRPIAYIEGLHYRQGLGWGQIAHRLGVHPGTFNQRRVWAKKHDAAVADGYLWGVVGGYYAIPRDTIVAFRNKGYPPAEVVMAANVAAHSGRPLKDVVALRAQKHPWDHVGSHFQVAAPKLKQAAPAKKHHPAAKGPKATGKPAPAGKGPQGKGRGRGKS